MSLTRSLSILRSLSPKLPRYSVFYCYERLFSSSGGADEPRPGGDWVVLLSEEKLKRKFDDFLCEFKELRDRVKLIQNIQPMSLRFTPDWVLLYEQEFEKQFEKFLSDYKQFKDESLQNSGMQPMVLKSEDLARKKVEKQLGCFRHGLKKFSDRTDKIQSICPAIMGKFWLMTKGYSSSIDNRNTSDVDQPPPEFEKQWEDIGLFIKGSMDRTHSILFDINYVMRLVALKYSSIIHNMSTSDTMKELKNLLNVLKDLYSKLGKSIMEHPDKYFSATTQKLISVLAFVHWMETGSLLVKSTSEEKMGCMFKFL